MQIPYLGSQKQALIVIVVALVLAVAIKLFSGVAVGLALLIAFAAAIYWLVLRFAPILVAINEFNIEDDQ